MEEDPEAQPLAELVVDARALRGLLIGTDRALGHGRGAAADQPLDTVLHHEVEPTRAGAHHGLPALHRLPERARHQGQLSELVAAVRDGRRERVALTLAGEFLGLARL